MKKLARLPETDHPIHSALLPKELLFNGSLRMELFEVPVFEDLAVLEMDQTIGLEGEFFIMGLLNKALCGVFVGKLRSQSFHGRSLATNSLPTLPVELLQEVLSRPWDGSMGYLLLRWSPDSCQGHNQKFLLKIIRL